MNPTHPLIPPASNKFQSDLKMGWYLAIPSEEDDEVSCIFIKRANRYWRFIIASVAEVEWRKIANVARANAHRCEPDQEGSKQQFFADCRDAEDNARAWREWGEEEKTNADA